MVSSSLISSCLPVACFPRRDIFTGYILVFLLCLFIAFQFYEAHFETRKHEPLRKDDPFKDSHLLSRNTSVFTSPMSILVFLSLFGHMSHFSGLKRNSCVAILWRVLPRYMKCPLKTARMGRLLSLHPWRTWRNRNFATWGSVVKDVFRVIIKPNQWTSLPRSDLLSLTWYNKFKTRFDRSQVFSKKSAIK